MTGDEAVAVARTVGPGATVLFLLAVLSSGCADDATPPEDIVVTDSVGVQITTVLRPAEEFDAIGSVTGQPLLELGRIEGDSPETFGSVTAVRLLPDGAIVVADGQAREVRVFGPDGTHRWSAGGQGDGPGEFRAINAIPFVSADSIWVWDRSANRVSVLGTDGTLIRSAMPTSSGATREVHPLPGGRMLSVRNAPYGDMPEVPPTAGMVLRPAREFVVLDGTTADPEPILSLPGGETFLFARGNVVSLTTMPFNRDVAYAVLGDLIVGGPNDRFELNQWNLDGALQRVTAFPTYDRPITDEDVEAQREARLSGIESDQTRQLIEDAFEVAEPPPIRPAFQQVLVSEPGLIWVREHGFWQANGQRWWVIRPDTGVPLGFVDMPAGFEAHEIGADYVLGVFQDALEVAYVRLYGMEMAIP